MRRGNLKYIFSDFWQRSQHTSAKNILFTLSIVLRHLNVFASGLDCHNFRILLLFTVFVYQAGFLVHLTGDLRIALAAVIGGIVNLLGMRRRL